MRTLITLSILLALSAPADANTVVEGTEREALIAALIATAPRYLDETTAAEHVDAAYAAVEGTEIDPMLLLAMAYVESRYQPDSVSRKVCETAQTEVCETVEGVWSCKFVEEKVCKRRTGRWKSRRRGSFTGKYFCGVLQVEAKTWTKCLAWRDDLAGTYRESALHLTDWLNTKRCRGKLRCALLGYGGGYKGIDRGTSTYPRRCTGRARRIHRELTKRLSI